MSRERMDEMFRQAFEGWEPAAPPRRQSFDTRLRSAFLSFRAQPRRGWNSVRAVGREQMKQRLWPVLAVSIAFLLAMIGGLSLPDSPVPPFKALPGMGFIPEGPKPFSGTTNLSVSTRKNGLRATGQSRKAKPNSQSEALEPLEFTNAPTEELLQAKGWNPVEITHQNPLKLNRMLVDSLPEIPAEVLNITGKKDSRVWRMDVGLGLFRELNECRFEMPQQISLAKNSGAEPAASNQWIRLGIRSRMGENGTWLCGFSLNLQQHDFSRARLSYAPINSLAGNPLHSNIFSPLGPVSGLSMEINYFAPEGDKQYLNADSLLAGALQGLRVERAELSLALGFSIGSKHRGTEGPSLWSWQAEAVLYPGWLVMNRATAYNEHSRAAVGEIEGLNLFTLSASVYAGLVYTAPCGLSMQVGPAIFTRLINQNTLNGYSGLPITLGLQAGLGF